MYNIPKWAGKYEIYIYWEEDEFDDENWVISDSDCNIERFTTKKEAIEYLKDNKEDYIQEYKEREEDYE